MLTHVLRVSAATASIYELPCTFIRADGAWVVQDEATALVFARFGFTHIVRRGSDGWRIVLAAAHDATTETTQFSPAAGD